MPKRRQAARDDDDSSDGDSEPYTQRRRVSQAGEDTAYGNEANGATQGDGNHEQMVKNLVRLALACEYTRAPLRRTDINTKVLGTHSRQFKVVFAAAQQHLKEIFGMELVELPVREKVTAKQRQAAAMAEMQAEQKRAETMARETSRKKTQAQTQATQSQTTKSNAWILTTTLPEEYRTADILSPSAAPSVEAESQYTALSSFVVSLITLSGGSLAESKLERYLARANVNEMTPFTNSMAMNALDRTEKLLKKMEKDGFIVKVKDNSTGDEVIEYIIGARGKVEIGSDGVKGLVREVYGDADDPEELERRLKRSLQMAAARLGEESQAIA